MKVFSLLFFIPIALLLLLVYVSRPDVPEVTGVINLEAGVPCLEHLDEEFHPGYFDLSGRVKVWYLRKADRWGLPISSELAQYFRGYIAVEMKVECFNFHSQSTLLNMAQPPREFKSSYNALITNTGFTPIP